MSNKKQTAVEWLVQNIPDLGKYIPLGVSMELHSKFEQAKELEKQQIIDAYNQANEDDTKLSNLSYEFENSPMSEDEYLDKKSKINESGEDYFKETYGE